MAAPSSCSEILVHVAAPFSQHKHQADDPSLVREKGKGPPRGPIQKNSPHLVPENTVIPAG